MLLKKLFRLFKNVPVLDNQTTYFDIDDTLVSWETFGTYTPNSIEFIDPDTNEKIYLEVITENVEALKRHRLRGHNIVLWSQGGAAWCKEVAKKLNITNSVDAYLRKPVWFYDDIPASNFMPESSRKHLRLKK